MQTAGLQRRAARHDLHQGPEARRRPPARHDEQGALEQDAPVADGRVRREGPRRLPARARAQVAGPRRLRRPWTEGRREGQGRRAGQRRAAPRTRAASRNERAPAGAARSSSAIASRRLTRRSVAASCRAGDDDGAAPGASTDALLPGCEADRRRTDRPSMYRASTRTSRRRRSRRRRGRSRLPSSSGATAPRSSDGSILPDGAQIDTASMDDWTYPVGTKAWKEFRVGWQAHRDALPAEGPRGPLALGRLRLVGRRDDGDPRRPTARRSTSVAARRTSFRSRASATIATRVGRTSCSASRRSRSGSRARAGSRSRCSPPRAG